MNKKHGAWSKNEKIFLVVCFFQFVYAYIISDHLRSHLQKLFVGIVGRNLREHSIDDIVDLTDLQTSADMEVMIL